MPITDISSEVVDDEVVDDQGEVDSEEEVTEEEPAETADDQGEDSEESGDLVISLAGEEEAKAEAEHTEAPQWVKDLRKEHRETVRELRALKAEKSAQAAQAEQQKAQAIGEKPTLAGCDYDEEKYEPQLAEWYKRKSEIEAKERDAQAQAERQNQEWQAKIEGHKKAAAALRVSDYDEASEAVKEAFTDIQYAIMHEADNSAVLEYAIGKRPAKIKELAAIKNPIKFAMALAKLETQVKTTAKKTAPAPETRVRASAPVSGAVDSKLAKLMEEADRTGDRTKVAAYRRAQRAA